jgi:hypothetical protein
MKRFGVERVLQNVVAAMARNRRFVVAGVCLKVLLSDLDRTAIPFEFFADRALPG